MRGYGAVYTRKISEGGTTLRWVYMQKFRSVWLTVACEQAVRGALAAGREKEGDLGTASLEFEFHLQFSCGSPSTELSDFRQSARTGNECKQTLKANDVTTNAISPNHAFCIDFFRCRYSYSFSHPSARAPRRACSLARLTVLRRN